MLHSLLVWLFFLFAFVFVLSCSDLFLGFGLDLLGFSLSSFERETERDRERGGTGWILVGGLVGRIRTQFWEEKYYQNTLLQQYMLIKIQMIENL